MDDDGIKSQAGALRSLRLERELRIMEVCGTHTTEFFRTGVRGLFPAKLSLIDGPGCPVCVTPNDYLDRAIEISHVHGVIVATFGDMVKVPSSYSSLGRERAGGLSLEVVYSPLDALELAAARPENQVVFLSVGFETTAPTEAATVLAAAERRIKNFSILCGNKLTPPAVKALLDSGETAIDGFILPGHVSAITGLDPWRFAAEDYGKPCVVAGFEAGDLILGVVTLLRMIDEGRNAVKNAYRRVVRDDGNVRAREIMYRVFEACDAHWRGLGLIPGSGLALREEYAEFDAEKRFPVTPPPVREHAGCRCGELLRGLIAPTDCGLFGKACTPEHAVGPCMVSSEGPCSAYHLYGGL